MTSTRDPRDVEDMAVGGVELTWFSTTPVAVTDPPPGAPPSLYAIPPRRNRKDGEASGAPSRRRVGAQPPAIPVHPRPQPDSQPRRRRSVRFNKHCEAATVVPQPGVSLQGSSCFGFDCRRSAWPVACAANACNRTGQHGLVVPTAVDPGQRQPHPHCPNIPPPARGRSGRPLTERRTTRFAPRSRDSPEHGRLRSGSRGTTRGIPSRWCG